MYVSLFSSNQGMLFLFNLVLLNLNALRICLTVITLQIYVMSPNRLHDFIINKLFILIWQFFSAKHIEKKKLCNVF